MGIDVKESWRCQCNPHSDDGFCAACSHSMLETVFDSLVSKLKEIERFGHNEGHGRGYTCAEMAAAALAELVPNTELKGRPSVAKDCPAKRL